MKLVWERTLVINEKPNLIIHKNKRKTLDELGKHKPFWQRTLIKIDSFKNARICIICDVYVRKDHLNHFVIYKDFLTNKNRTVWIPHNVISLKRNEARHPACTAVENGRTFGDGKLFMDSIQTTVWLVPAKPNSPFLFFFFQARAFLKIHKWFYFWLQK